MISWLRPSNRSIKATWPPGSSNTYPFSPFSHGSPCRSRVNSSRIREKSFSFFSSSLRAATHSSWETILRSIIVVLLFTLLVRDQRRGKLRAHIADHLHHGSAGECGTRARILPAKPRRIYSYKIPNVFVHVKQNLRPGFGPETGLAAHAHRDLM